MYKILLACSGGFSSYTLLKTCKKGAKEFNEDIKIHAVSAKGIEKELEEKATENEQWDVLMIAPQIRHEIKEAKIIAEKYNLPCELIPMKLYSPSRYKELFTFIKEIIDNYHNK